MISFVMILVIFLIGVVGVISDWFSGLCAVVIVGLIYFLQKILKLKWILIVIIALAGIGLLSYFMDLSFPLLLLTSIGLSFVFFLKSAYEETKIDESFEIFYLDSKKLKCLSTNDNDYKGYSLNPKGFLKTYDTSFINSFYFKGNHLLINIGTEIIRPRELNQEDLQSIREYLNEYFPKLLNNNEDYQENLKKENLFYLQKFLIILPIILLSLVIYFFGDNGRNVPLTYVCLALMILLPYLIFKLIKRN